MAFKDVNPRQSFPDLELKILNFWKENDVFRQSIENRKNAPEYTFYDGPPFATGLPHYGHILAGTIKDVIPRYQTMRGNRVERRFGWDCHGLPVENLIEKELGLGDKQAILEYGIDNFNEACRASVLRYASEWEKIVERMGRWVDFQNDYKTMDPEFMESVWWVFDQLWQKGLVYEGHKPMHICPRCVTPLSNFEVNLGYKEITDQSVVVKFKLVESEELGVGGKKVPLDKGDTGGLNTYILAWTTTPWTLPGNVALAVNPEVDYVKVLHEDFEKKIKEFIIVSKTYFDNFLKTEEEELNNEETVEFIGVTNTIDGNKFDKKDSFSKEKTLRGSDLLGCEYEPLFPYFAEQKNDEVYREADSHDQVNDVDVSLLNDSEEIKALLNFVVENQYQKEGVEIEPEIILGKQDDKNINYFVAKKDGKIVGTIALKNSAKDSTKAYLQFWVVAKDLRGLGIGKKLLETVVNFAKSQNLTRLIANARQTMIETYEKCGFVRVQDGNISVWNGIERVPYEFFVSREFKCEQKNQKGFRVVGADFVTTEDGTGIVHIAPAFGEDDLNVAKENNLPFVQHISMEGKFTDDVTDFSGQEVKPKDDSMKTDRKIVEFLKLQNKVFDAKTYRHSYPHCWRCDTPLLNYATSSWFVKVEEIKEKLLSNNQQIAWVPEHLKNGRFGKWLENARDWAISRNRYWGTPLPIWRCDNPDCTHTESLGSIAELEKKSGENVTDIHKHFVDNLTWGCSKCQGGMRRIEEVFDCWFESGSMPYAQKHYPFAYNRKLKNTYYVLRHGEGEHNISNLISCDPVFGCKNTALTEKGRQEVQENVQIFNKMKLDVIYSSDFLRTKQTAEILNEVAQTKIIYDKRLREFNVGEFHGKDLHFYEDTYPNKEIKWQNAPQGGETYTEVESRMLEVLNEIEAQYEGKTIVLVSHGDPLKILLGSLNGEFKKITAYANCPQKGIPEKIKLKTEEDFLKVFPADFIAEGLDQTRGWFYTLHVLASALFDQPAFQNVIVNGIVLAEDGQKMSKSKQNYPDPNLVFENYGADAMRFYLMNSPVVKADDLRFSEHGVNEVVKGVILPLWNSYSFFVTYAKIDGWKPSVSQEEQQVPQVDFQGGVKSNKLDRWILSALNKLIGDVTQELDEYDLQKAAQPIFGFIDNLTNWYIRRSRRRFWKSENDADKNEAYETLYEVLIAVSKIIAPFMPFIAEEIYQNLTNHNVFLVSEAHPESEVQGMQKMATKGGIDSGQAEMINSVHLADWPSVNKTLINEDLNAEMMAIQQIVKLGLVARAKAKIKVRQPLQKIQLALSEKYDLHSIQSEFGVIQEELNIKEIEVIQDAEEIAVMTASPDARKLGPKYGKEVQNIIKEAKQGNFIKLENGNYKILAFEILPEEIEVIYQGKEGFNVEADQGMVVALDTQITDDLKLEGLAREMVRLIQDMRKEADYRVDDRIEVYLVAQGKDLNNSLTSFKEYIINETLAIGIILERGKSFDIEKTIQLEDENLYIALRRCN